MIRYRPDVELSDTKIPKKRKRKTRPQLEANVENNENDVDHGMVSHGIFVFYVFTRLLSRISTPSSH